MLYALGILGWIVAIVAIGICCNLIYDNARAWKRLRDLVDIPVSGMSLEEAIVDTIEGYRSTNIDLRETQSILQDNCAALDLQNGALEIENSNLKSARDELVDRISRLQSTMEEESQRADNYLAACTTQHENRYRALEKENAAERTALREMADHLASVTGEAVLLEALPATVNSYITKFHAVHTLERENAELRKVRDALRAAMASASRQCRTIEESLVVVSIDALPKQGTSLTHEPPNDGSPQFWGTCGVRLHSFPSEELRDEWVRESPEFNKPLADKTSGGKRFGKELWDVAPIVYHRPIVAEATPSTSEGTTT